MSIIFRFPFRWGGDASSATVPATATPLWTRTSVSARAWQTQAPTVRRFEHIFPEADTGPGWIRVTSVVS